MPFKLGALLCALALGVGCFLPALEGSGSGPDGGPIEGGTVDGGSGDGGSPGGDEAYSTLSLIAGTPGRTGNSDGVGAAAGFDGPEGLAWDGTGHLFIADQGNNLIREINLATAAVTTVVGVRGTSGDTDGTGATVRLSGPWGLAWGGVDRLFFVDRYNDQVREFDVATTAVTTLAGRHTVGDDAGIGAWADINFPEGLCSDGTSHLFVADTEGATIQEIDIATGAATILAGTAGATGYADGIGAAARFARPDGLACDDAGHLFVADRLNNAIREIDVATAAVTTLAGSPGVEGSDDGTGLAARFSRPTGLAYDGAAHLFVADTGNHEVRVVDVATAAVSTLAGVPSRDWAVPGPLPASLEAPSGLVFAPGVGLFVSDAAAGVILLIH